MDELRKDLIKSFLLPWKAKGALRKATNSATLALQIMSLIVVFSFGSGAKWALWGLLAVLAVFIPLMIAVMIRDEVRFSRLKKASAERLEQDLSEELAIIRARKHLYGDTPEEHREP